MKMKEFGPPGGGARPWCPPLGSANGDNFQCETETHQSFWKASVTHPRPGEITRCYKIKVTFRLFDVIFYP